MTDKETLIDKIIREKLIINKANLEYCAKNETINGFLLQSIRDAMQAYHEAKMKEVTDADIVKYAFNCYPDSYNMRVACVNGAKAMRDGEIKHVSRDNDR